MEQVPNKTALHTNLRLRPESDDPDTFSLSELLAELLGRSLCGADYAVVGIW